MASFPARASETAGNWSFSSIFGRYVDFYITSSPRTGSKDRAAERASEFAIHADVVEGLREHRDNISQARDLGPGREATTTVASRNVNLDKEGNVQWQIWYYSETRLALSHSNHLGTIPSFRLKATITLRLQTRNRLEARAARDRTHGQCSDVLPGRDMLAAPSRTLRIQIRTAIFSCFSPTRNFRPAVTSRPNPCSMPPMLHSIGMSSQTTPHTVECIDHSCFG
jgi:hypothetical protein